MIPNRPIVFYAVAFYIGCMVYIVFENSVITGAVLAASFLIIFLLTVDKKYFVIIMGFFSAGVFAALAYYHISVLNNVETIRINSNINNYCIGSINGRKIVVKGELEKLKEGNIVLTEGKFEEKVDYSRGIVGIFYIDKFTPGKADIISKLYSLKRNSYIEFEKRLGKERAAMVMSLCFGEADYLSEEQKYDFQELGVVHAISVSGFHMAVIYKILESILGFEVSMLVSFVYMIFTGTQSATLRAFLMIFVLRLSKKVFRNYDSLSALGVSALIILAAKPYYVLDVGFSLSYLSTLGIILYYNKIKRFFFKLPKMINESFSLTISAQVFSMSYAGMVFNNVSFGFLLGNIILLPMYTGIVVAGNIALLIIKLQIVFNAVCYVLNLIITAVEGASYLLLAVTPPVSDISYLSSLGILKVVSAFILVKKGFNKFKYVPLFILCMIMLQSYSFFPKIEYVNLGGRDGVILSYKAERILIHNLREDLNQSVKVKFTKVISNPDSSLIFRLGKNYSVKMIPAEEYDRRSIDLEVTAHNSKTILTRNTENYMDIDLRKYDIIRLPKQQYYAFKGKLSEKTPRNSYTVLFEKVYALQKD